MASPTRPAALSRGPRMKPRWPAHDLLAGEPGGLDQGAEPRPAAVGQQLEAVPTRMRFSPCSGTTSATVASATRSSRWNGRFAGRPERRHQRLDQLERDAGAAEAVGARRVVGPLRIDHRERRGQLGAGQVVVGHDHADARAARARARCPPP